MKSKENATYKGYRLAILILIGLPSLITANAATVYRNTFDDQDSLNTFTAYGGEFASSTLPLLHSASIDTGQLRIDTTAQHPAGMTSLSGDTSTSFSPVYDPVLSRNNGLISWSFNVSNRDNAPYNNSFACILASTRANPFSHDQDFAQGYVFTGGGMIGNRMALRRFDYGLGGSGEMLVDITEGLALLPEKGSFRITFDPAISEWSLYAETGAEYTDPARVNSLLGSAVDDTYTTIETRYFGLAGSNSGTSYFDNYTVNVVPEPAAAAFMLAAFVGAGIIRRWLIV